MHIYIYHCLNLLTFNMIIYIMVGLTLKTELTTLLINIMCFMTSLTAVVILKKIKKITIKFTNYLTIIPIYLP
jgi:hypothetical protein